MKTRTRGTTTQKKKKNDDGGGFTGLMTKRPQIVWKTHSRTGTGRVGVGGSGIRPADRQTDTTDGTRVQELKKLEHYYRLIEAVVSHTFETSWDRLEVVPWSQPRSSVFFWSRAHSIFSVAVCEYEYVYRK